MDELIRAITDFRNAVACLNGRGVTLEFRGDIKPRYGDHGEACYVGEVIFTPSQRRCACCGCPSDSDVCPDCMEDET